LIFLAQGTPKLLGALLKRRIFLTVWGDGSSHAETS
jgi:hypothetical protein